MKKGQYKVTHYKPNVVYILRIRGIYYYVGCVNTSRKYFTPIAILRQSGNSLNLSFRKGLITLKEYYENVELISVEEFDTKEAVLEREIELIHLYKNEVGNLLLNKGMYGNAHTNKGCKFDSSVREKMSISHKGKLLGRKTSEETKKKISNTLSGRKSSEETKYKLSIARQGRKPFVRKIIDTTTGIVYESIKDCALLNNFSYSGFKSGLKNNYPKYKNFKYYNEHFTTSSNWN